jgi:hypothetical protein
MINLAAQNLTPTQMMQFKRNKKLIKALKQNETEINIST